ncbi:TfuA-like protein [uncultured Roseobacter sp.]|uniref:TfuA-like protein n=1 Tax=uncultured Roseobacter sp. TaxID=114847 RepID=UPI00262ACEE9|nr:TfuA-like protein [uncultured Roseobacter sp.]
MIVFAGPSIAGCAPDRLDGFDLRPPVRQGDVYLASLERPRAIGIIDGYFDSVPAVWHKEILWALSLGIPVLGAASMGALRAAELDVFGMIGVGEVYAAYRDNVLEDDDEVALLHGPAEVGYPNLTLAMVNLRATLAAAEAEGMLSGPETKALIAEGKVIFYHHRTWDSVLAKAPSVRRASLADWIAAHEVDQKARDADALLALMQAGSVLPPAVDFHFEETGLWQEATQRWQARAPLNDTAGPSRGLSFLDD